MTPNPFLGVFFHSVGGFAAASFYIPYKKVRAWSWETYWLTGGVQLWIIGPLIVALVTVPNLLHVFQQANPKNLALTFLFGLGWGVGHLTFGLSLRYLGLSLGIGLYCGFDNHFRGTATSNHRWHVPRADLKSVRARFTRRPLCLHNRDFLLQLGRYFQGN